MQFDKGEKGNSQFFSKEVIQGSSRLCVSSSRLSGTFFITTEALMKSLASIHLLAYGSILNISPLLHLLRPAVSQPKLDLPP